MSLRTLPADLAARVAALEEFVRRLQGDNAISPTDTRYLYTAKGDILVATGAATPLPLSIVGLPPMPGSMVLRINPGDPQGVEWHFVAGI